MKVARKKPTGPRWPCEWRHNAKKDGHTLVVRVEVDAIIPDFDTSEPCLEPEAIRFLDEVQDKANRGLIGELKKLGEVYVLQTA